VKHDHSSSPQTRVAHFNRPYKRHELLTGRIVYPVLGCTGYGDGVGTNLRAFVTAEVRADWATNREEFLEFWQWGKTTADVFPADNLPSRQRIWARHDGRPQRAGRPWSRVRRHPVLLAAPS